MSTDELNPDGFTRPLAVLSDDAFNQGRRSFLLARDLQIGEATGEKFGINHNRLNGAITSTGWHYHPVGLQIIYVLKGFIDLAFEDGQVIRIEEGGCMNIPPGMIHNEVRTSDEMDVLEISMPAKIATVNVPARGHAGVLRDGVNADGRSVATVNGSLGRRSPV